LSQADKEFVDSLDVSLARVATVLEVSRQAVSRGVQRTPDNYFDKTDLARLLAHFEQQDPFRFKLAKSSIVKLYPKVAAEVLGLLEANGRSDFDSSVAGEYSIVTGDFVGLMGRLENCKAQVDSLIQNLETRPGTLKFIVSHSDQARVEKYKNDNWSIDHSDQRIRSLVCELDLSLFPTCLMRIGEDYSVDIFAAGDSGFVPLSNHESFRIKQTIERMQETNQIH
jgi:hypothetical protein